MLIDKFEYFMENCKNYHSPEYFTDERTPWMHRCANFEINKNSDFPNCFYCSNNTTKKNLCKIISEKKRA